MVDLSQLQLKDFHYDLPPERIAQFPLPQRDQSQLIVSQAGTITHHVFAELPALLPSGSLLVLNDTRVIPARIHLRRQTGALIEILLLHPKAPREIQLAMQATETCEWQCMVGNKKRWKSAETLELKLPHGKLHAQWTDREHNEIAFTWELSPTGTFAEVLKQAGSLPLPPYLNRDPTPQDYAQYQTVYAHHDGAVAAPTAGLHFTSNVFDDLQKKGIELAHLSLHVGAGTFLPVKGADIANHHMHAEQMIIPLERLQQLRDNLGKIIAVGTTSARLLESIYWLGLGCIHEKHSLSSPFHLDQFAPYAYAPQEHLPPRQVLDKVIHFMESHHIPKLWGETSLFIVPGYSFQLCRGLITNFHLPESTLILLIAALVGEHWREIYQEALSREYRFLSYGDSSLLLP